MCLKQSMCVMTSSKCLHSTELVLMTVM